jgi:hypothetical protein
MCPSLLAPRPLPFGRELVQAGELPFLVYRTPKGRQLDRHLFFWPASLEQFFQVPFKTVLLPLFYLILPQP